MKSVVHHARRAWWRWPRTISYSSLVTAGYIAMHTQVHAAAGHALGWLH